jgi:hypothetical protein
MSSVWDFSRIAPATWNDLQDSEPATGAGVGITTFNREFLEVELCQVRTISSVTLGTVNLYSGTHLNGLSLEYFNTATNQWTTPVASLSGFPASQTLVPVSFSPVTASRFRLRTPQAGQWIGVGTWRFASDCPSNCASLNRNTCAVGSTECGACLSGFVGGSTGQCVACPTCQNGGTCAYNAGSQQAECQCTAPFFGAMCERPTAPATARR